MHAAIGQNEDDETTALHYPASMHLRYIAIRQGGSCIAIS